MGTYRWKPHTLLVSAEEVERKVVKLEADKYYKTRDGRKVGPMRELDRKLTDYPWTDQYGEAPDLRYSDSGKEVGRPMSYDLIYEWQDEAPSPIRTVTRREIVPGVYGKVFINDYDSLENTVSLNVKDDFGCVSFNAEELREAAHILNQIAEALEENGK